MSSKTLRRLAEAATRANRDRVGGRVAARAEGRRIRDGRLEGEPFRLDGPSER